MGTNPANFVKKIAQRMPPAGCLYSTFQSNLSKIFSFWGRCHCTDGGEIWHGGGDRPQNTPVFNLFKTNRLVFTARLRPQVRSPQFGMPAEYMSCHVKMSRRLSAADLDHYGRGQTGSEYGPCDLVSSKSVNDEG